MESKNLVADWSKEEDRRACEFVTKIKVFDEDINHRGIFKQYITAMKLYKSGTFNVVDLKNIIAFVFRNCETLLIDFNQLLKNAHDDASNHKQILGLVEAVSRDCKELREEFIEAFKRHMEHQDVHILKKEIDLILRNYPSLKEEFKMILLSYGYEIKEELTHEQEDEMYEDDMYIKCIDSAIEFEAAEDNDEKPPVAVYGAIRRYYEQRHMRIPQDSMKNPKLAIRPALERKRMKLLEKEYNY